MKLQCKIHTCLGIIVLCLHQPGVIPDLIFPRSENNNQFIFFPFSENILDFQICRDFIIFFFDLLCISLCNQPGIVQTPDFISNPADFLSICINFQRKQTCMIYRHNSIPHLCNIHFRYVSVQLCHTVISFIKLDDGKGCLLHRRCHIFIILIGYDTENNQCCQKKP